RMLAPRCTVHLVTPIACYASAAPRSGLINLVFAEIFGPWFVLNVKSTVGIDCVLTLVSMPYAYVFLSRSFRNMDPSLEEASYANGVGTLATIRRVTLPLTTPAIEIGR